MKGPSWLDRDIPKARVKPYGAKGSRRGRILKEEPKRLMKSSAAIVAIDPLNWEKPTGDDIIDWIERKCYVPEGKLMGTLFRLGEWQKIEIRRIYDNKAPGGTRRAI